MDIRHSDILNLEEKVKKLSYRRYLPKITLLNVRSFDSQTITFDFPVTAVIGTNGGGKSTILGAAALAYRDVKPGNFFPKSNIGDNSMANWRIEYEILDRAANKTATFPRNAHFTKAKWRRDNVAEREVVVIPIQRTVPANEQTKFKHFIGITANSAVSKKPIHRTVIEHVSRILGKDAKGYERVTLKSDKSKSILVGMRGANDYSQFHFGAGEASIIEMVSRIEESDDNSLILIEEIENGLHPLATEKMVEYLIDVADRKSSQIIFTTHSEYALTALPPKAIWACIEGVAYQGKLTIESLRALTGKIAKDAAVFVEDDFAKDMVEEIFRQYASDIFDRIQVHKAGGYPYVVNVLNYHLDNPATPHPATAIIDGDNPPLEKPNASVFELPKGAPEVVVFEYIRETAEKNSALIKQRCQCPGISQTDLLKAIENVARDTTDHHLYFAKLGDSIGFISELIIRRGLISIYVEQNAASLKSLAAAVRTHLKL